MLRIKDCYYTKPEIARQLVALLPPIPDGTTVIDPAAGAGAFASCFSRCIALDLHPTAQSIIQADFFKWEPPTGVRLWVVTNPPFGSGMALAVRFFNRSATLAADLIAFILPRTWRKRLAQLDAHYSLLAAHPVPTTGFFSFKFTDIDVPTEWTIWTRSTRAPLPPPLSNPDVQFMPSATGADLIISRTGRNAGRIHNTTKTGRSFYYIRISDPGLLERVRANPTCFTDSDQRNWCSGMPNLNQQDVLAILARIAPTTTAP